MGTDRKLEIVLAAKDITGQAFTKLQGRMTALAKSVLSLHGATAILAGTTGLGLLFKTSLNTADQIGKTADKLGITTDALQEYEFMASQSGVATKTMEMALRRFTRRMAEAVQGKGELKGVLDQYNITLKDTAGNTRKTTDVLEDLADIIKHTEDPAERLRIAFKAFDSEGTAMINTLKGGSTGLKNWAQEARDLGIVIDNDLIRSSEKANDELDKLSKVISAHFKKALLAVAPSIADIAKDTTDWVKANQGLIQQKIPEYLDNIGQSLKLIADMVMVMPRTTNLLDDVLGISASIESSRQLTRVAQEMFAVFSGQKDWNTGLPTGAVDRMTEEFDRLHTAYTTVISDTDQLGTIAQGTITVFDEYDQMIQKFNQELDGMALAATEYAAPAIDELDQMIQDFDNELNGAALAATDFSDVISSSTQQAADDAKRAAEGAAEAFQQIASTFSDSLANTFADIVTGSKSAREAFRDMAKSMIRYMIQLIVRQLIFRALFSGFGKGGVFDQSGLIPFANGGVVNRPTVFPFASGVGLMGEAGPEAIMPLTRTSGGDLGVKAEGGGGNTHITNYIVAMDSRSIEETLRRNPAAITSIVEQNIYDNGSVRSAIRRTI